MQSFDQEVTKLCHVCELAPATLVCLQCGSGDSIRDRFYCAEYGCNVDSHQKPSMSLHEIIPIQEWREGKGAQSLDGHIDNVDELGTSTNAGRTASTRIQYDREDENGERIVVADTLDNEIKKALDEFEHDTDKLDNQLSQPEPGAEFLVEGDSDKSLDSSTDGGNNASDKGSNEHRLDSDIVMCGLCHEEPAAVECKECDIRYFCDHNDCFLLMHIAADRSHHKRHQIKSNEKKENRSESPVSSISASDAQSVCNESSKPRSKRNTTSTAKRKRRMRISKLTNSGKTHSRFGQSRKPTAARKLQTSTSRASRTAADFAKRNPSSVSRLQTTPKAKRTTRKYHSSRREQSSRELLTHFPSSLNQPPTIVKVSWQLVLSSPTYLADIISKTFSIKEKFCLLYWHAVFEEWVLLTDPKKLPEFAKLKVTYKTGASTKRKPSKKPRRPTSARKTHARGYYGRHGREHLYSLSVRPQSARMSRFHHSDYIGDVGDDVVDEGGNRHNGSLSLGPWDARPKRIIQSSVFTQDKGNAHRKLKSDRRSYSPSPSCRRSTSPYPSPTHFGSVPWYPAAATPVKQKGVTQDKRDDYLHPSFKPELRMNSRWKKLGGQANFFERLQQSSESYKKRNLSLNEDKKVDSFQPYVTEKSHRLARTMNSFVDRYYEDIERRKQWQVEQKRRQQTIIEQTPPRERNQKITQFLRRLQYDNAKRDEFKRNARTYYKKLNARKR